MHEIGESASLAGAGPTPAFVLEHVSGADGVRVAGFVREGQPAEAVSPQVRWRLCFGGGCVLVGVARLLGC
jgi:hypothetical protein